MTQRVVIGLVALACTLTLAGCAGADASAAGHPSSSASDLAASEPAATAPTQPEPSGVTDADTCAAIGDVVTIVFNAELGVHEGRMSAQEQQGWYRLATRAFDRVQTSGSGELSEAVAELQAAIPPAAPAAMGTSLVGTDVWEATFPRLYQSCTDAGSEIVVQGFTGG